MFESLCPFHNDLDVLLEFLEGGEVLGDLLGVFLSFVGLEVKVDLLFININKFLVDIKSLGLAELTLNQVLVFLHWVLFLVLRDGHQRVYVLVVGPGILMSLA